jgi:putative Ca2+/H+ antiporter (TMEM165/GDT1 family)
MSLAATGGQKWLVFAAAALALVLSSLLAVIVGDLLRSRIDPVLVQRTAAALFLVLGSVMLYGSFRAQPPEAAAAVTEPKS